MDFTITIRGGEGEMSFGDPGRSVLRAEGTVNLVPADKQKFVGWYTNLPEDVTVVLTQDQAVPEWGAQDATRIQTSGGSTLYKYYLNVANPTDSGVPYTVSVYVKNIGIKPVAIQDNNPATAAVTVLPGQAARIVLSGSDPLYGILQIAFFAEQVADELDFIAWHPQGERKPHATDWTGGTRADVYAIDPASVVPAVQDTILNNIFLSLAIERGSWWFNPGFGLRPLARLKNTDKTARLVQAYIHEALQWLLDTGRATAIEVTVAQDRLQDTNRLTAIVQATQADGRQVTFEKYIQVV